VEEKLFSAGGVHQKAVVALPEKSHNLADHRYSNCYFVLSAPLSMGRRVLFFPKDFLHAASRLKSLRLFY
jgi:hypothetical protein